MSILVGVHPVREALRAGQSVERVVVAKGVAGSKVQEIIDLCRAKGVPVRFEPREVVERAAEGRAHQGVVAFGAAQSYTPLERVVDGAKLLVLLDGVEDPHNLGAIIRTANAVGADAVLVPERRSAGLTETVAKASAGAVAYTPVVRIGNVSQTLRSLKDRGFWVYGLDERGTRAYDEVDYGQPAVLVFGGEGHGLHDLVRKTCDEVVRIPMAGDIASLNVSVAAGVVLFGWKRGRSGHPA